MERTECRLAPTILRRVRRLALLLLAAVALGGCGGGEDKQSVEDVHDQAFRQQIKSADLRIEAELDLNGGSSAGQPVRIEASGPFRTNEGRLPSADIDLRFGVDGAGQTIQTGFLSTGDRAFVKFEDVFYEQPAAEVRRANRTIARNAKKRGSLHALGIDPRSWLGRATDEGEEEIAGVQTRHVAGTLDVEAVMRNLNKFVRRSGAALGGATGQSVPAPLATRRFSAWARWSAIRASTSTSARTTTSSAASRPGSSSKCRRSAGRTLAAWRAARSRSRWR